MKRSLAWSHGMVCILAGLVVDARAQETNLPPTTINSSDTAPLSSSQSEHKRFGIELQYDYTLHNDLRHNELAASASPNTVNAKLTGMRGLASLKYLPTPGSQVSAYLGSALLNEMTVTGGSAAVGEAIQVVPLDNAVVFGAGARIDLFPQWRFHLVPSFRYLRSEFGSTRGTLSNSVSGCTYDTTTNSASTCVTPGQTTGGGVMLTRFSQNEFLFRIEACVDIGGEINNPIIGIYLGAEEAIQILNGQFIYSVPGVGTSFEAYTFTSARTEGIYASLRGHAGPVRMQVEARGLTTTQFSGSVAIAF